MPLVIFDLDNTLLDRTAPFRRWATHFVARYGLAPTEVDWLIRADGDGFVSREKLMSAVRARYDLRESLVDLLDSFRAEIVALVDLEPQVPVALQQLRAAGWRVAIATNGSTAQQSAKIRRVGLFDQVDAVAISEEVGAAKPDPRMFAVAAQRCGARLDDGGWMVGDCPVRDVSGAQQVGLRTIWVRRGRAWDPAARHPDAIVDHVAETVRVLAAAPPGDPR